MLNAGWVKTSVITQPIVTNLYTNFYPNSHCTCTHKQESFSFIDVASIPSKRVRRPTRGVGLEKLIKGTNKLLIDIPAGKGRFVCEVQSVKLSFEIGVITQQFIPIPRKWRALKNTKKFHAFERLNVSSKYLLYFSCSLFL